MKEGRLFVISAPSGAGKSTLIERLRALSPDLAYSISCTTRQPRGDEKDGIHYYFLSRDRFETMIRNDEFLEFKEVHGNFYGTPAEPVAEVLKRGGSIILDIDVMGALEVFKRVRNAVGVFISAPDMEALEKRLRARGTDSEASIQTRMRNAVREIEIGSSFQYQIVNDDLERAVKDLASIIRKESGLS
ncbi:MAG: guanylate kinase [Desulfomonile tiedjei]|nr:guanylate kinase [Desulfomonile tiedjei]